MIIGFVGSGNMAAALARGLAGDVDGMLFSDSGSGRAAALAAELGGEALSNQEVAVGWWPGDPKHGGAAFYAYAHPAQPGFAAADLGVAGARWDGDLGEYVLEWDAVAAAADPHGLALDFARAAFRHACRTCGWDAELAATADGTPPPVA